MHNVSCYLFKLAASRALAIVVEWYLGFINQRSILYQNFKQNRCTKIFLPIYAKRFKQ